MSSPPVSGTAYTFYVGLVSQADTNIFQAAPTLAAGDFTVSTDAGVTFGNLATLPSATAGNNKIVTVALSGGEMTPSSGDKIIVTWSDQAGSEWQDSMAMITVGTRDVDDLAYPAVSGRSLTVDANGRVDVSLIEGTDATDQIRDSVLSDATRFAGANIDASISTRGTLANQTTLLARIGAFTGAGVNTILGVLQAMAQKAATLPTDIGGTFTPVLHSLEAIRDALQRSPAVASITANELTMVRGDTYDSDNDDPIESLGDISGRTTLWLTAKRSRDQVDIAAILQITEADGLVRLNGAAAANAAWASITVTDEVAGDITVVVDENATQDLVPATLDYDIQVLIGGNVTTLRTSTLVIPADVTRSIT